MFKLSSGQEVILLFFDVAQKNYILKTNQEFNFSDVLVDPFGRRGIHVHSPHQYAHFAQQGYYGFKISHADTPGLLLIHSSKLNIIPTES